MKKAKKKSKPAKSKGREAKGGSSEMTALHFPLVFCHASPSLCTSTISPAYLFSLCLLHSSDPLLAAAIAPVTAASHPGDTRMTRAQARSPIYEDNKTITSVGIPRTQKLYLLHDKDARRCHCFLPL